MARVAHRTGGRGRKPTAKQLTAAVRSTWLNRGGLLDDEQADAIAAIEPIGRPSSAVGRQAWRDWYGPLFLDTEATHRRKRFNDAWALPPEHVETVDRDPAVAPDREQVVTERHVATVTVANVLRETLVTELGIDPNGNPVPKKPAPDGVDAGTFDALDVVSASLTGLDDALAADGQREQGGFVHMNRVRVFDTFGASAGWSSSSAALDPLPEWATAIPARLTSWGRLNLRLQSGAAPDSRGDAVRLTGLRLPAPGLRRPGARGLRRRRAAGRAAHGYRPGRGQHGPGDAHGDVHASAVGGRHAPGRRPGDRRDHEPDAAAPRAGARRAVARRAEPHTRMARDRLHRDAARVRHGSLDTRTRRQARGRARAVARRARRGAVREGVVRGIRRRPSPSCARDRRPSPMRQRFPVLRVRIGDVTRPDDGVLGCFVTGATPADDRFAPPSPQAVEEAVLNQMVTSAGVQKTREITHPFIAGQVSEFDVPANQPLDLVVLADVRGGIYATCGMLPRKSIVMPKDFIEPALERLRPTFRVGPILGFERDEFDRARDAGAVHRGHARGLRARRPVRTTIGVPEVPIPPVLGVGELPPSRVRLTEGWARMVPQEP